MRGLMTSRCGCVSRSSPWVSLRNALVQAGGGGDEVEELVGVTSARVTKTCQMQCIRKMYTCMPELAVQNYATYPSMPGALRALCPVARGVITGIRPYARYQTRAGWPVTVGASYANLVIYLKSHSPQFRRRNYGWKRRDAGANNKGAISFDHRARNC